MKLLEAFFREETLQLKDGTLRYSVVDVEGKPAIFIEGIGVEEGGQGTGTQLYFQLVELMRKQGIDTILGEQHDLDGRPYHIRTKIPNSITHAYLDIDEIEEQGMEDEVEVMNHPFFGNVGRITEEDGTPMFDPGEYAPLFLETTLI